MYVQDDPIINIIPHTFLACGSDNMRCPRMDVGVSGGADGMTGVEWSREEDGMYSGLYCWYCGNILSSYNGGGSPVGNNMGYYDYFS